jgi:II/X family phage/plasmid replication protein
VLDSVKIRSPYLDEATAAAVEAVLETRRAVDNSSGVVMYEFVSGRLEGSYDHRISCVVRREKFVSVTGPDGRKQTVVEECRPYLEIEGSIHKALCGHNVYGGPLDIRQSIIRMVINIGKALDVWLPYGADWEVRRIDWSEVYDLGGDVVQAYLWSMRQANYPRRKIRPFGNETVMFPGRTTAVKFYHKGPEFKAHDYKRLLKANDLPSLDWLHDLAARAERYLRVEVAIKAPVLDEAYNGAPTVAKLSAEWVADVWEREVVKVLREGRSDERVVRTAEEVRGRLYALYGSRLAGALYATWFQLSSLGEEKARAGMNRATFYRHREQLVAAGCSWRGTNAVLLDAPTVIPADFVPNRMDRRRVVEVDPRVLEALVAA